MSFPYDELSGKEKKILFHENLRFTIKERVSYNVLTVECKFWLTRII
jgi:hypothetical protein